MKGYYPYDSIVDIVGFFKPQPPFNFSTRTIVEIRTDEPSEEDIEGFMRLSRNTNAEKRILFVAKRKDELISETQLLISKETIEYFDSFTLDEFLKKSGTVDISQITNACDIFSPKKLASVIPELARQEIPEHIGKYLPTQQAWEILEDSVFAVFRFCFEFETKQLGKESLFKHEPEGMVVCPTEKGDFFGMMYDCKSSKSAYTMSKDDELTYIDYIKEKQNIFRDFYKCSLRYFLIISPKFSGDLELRRNAVYSDTGVLLCFIRAITLKKIALWSYELPQKMKRIIDISKFLLPTEITVSNNTLDNYISNFNTEKSKY